MNYERDGIAGMVTNVLAGDVGKKLLESKSLNVEDKQALLAELRSVFARPYIEPKLKRHVESRQVMGGIELRSGNVVDTVPALFDDPHDLLKANSTGVRLLKSTPRPKAAVLNSEHGSTKQVLVLSVERTIDEHRTFEGGRSTGSRSASSPARH
ncbi:MAG: hypothetical protein IV100_13420 [Myxococcales bacterium]|nr:hypothetical protein [Myxococcales bacterium]